MVHASTGGMKSKSLTADQLREANEYRAVGFSLVAIASAFGVSEFELKVELSSAERVRQIEALGTLASSPGGR